MTVGAVDNLGLAPGSEGKIGAAANAAGGGFAGDLAAARERARLGELRQKASEFVNQVFYGTLLREFRDAQQPGLLDRGPGAQTFIRQLDGELIRRISRRGDAPLVNAVLRQLGIKEEQLQEMNRVERDRGLAMEGLRYRGDTKINL